MARTMAVKKEFIAFCAIKLLFCKDVGQTGATIMERDKQW